MRGKLKSSIEILEIFLRKEFMKDFLVGKCCASDQIPYIVDDKQLLDGYFDKWLIAQGYAHGK